MFLEEIYMFCGGNIYVTGGNIYAQNYDLFHIFNKNNNDDNDNKKYRINCIIIKSCYLYNIL